VLVFALVSKKVPLVGYFSLRDYTFSIPFHKYGCVVHVYTLMWVT